MGESNFGDGNKRGINWEFPKTEKQPDETQVIKKDYYVILGVNKGATVEQVIEAYDKKIASTKNHVPNGNMIEIRSNDQLKENLKMVPKWTEARDAILKEIETVDTDELPKLPEQPVSQEIPKPVSRFEVKIEPNYFERQEERIPEIWEKIKDDRQLRAVLAYCLLTDDSKSKFIANRDYMSLDQLHVFYKKYPNLQTYSAHSKVMELPSQVTVEDKKFVGAKQQEYFNAVDRFTRLMYPESFEKK